MYKIITTIVLLLAMCQPVSAAFWVQMGSPVAESGALCTDTTTTVYEFDSGEIDHLHVTSDFFSGQTFNSGTITGITGVRTIVQDIGASAGSVTAHLYAYDTTNTEPTGSELASVTVAMTSISTSEVDHYFEFDTAYSFPSAGDYVIYWTGASGASMHMVFDTTPSIAGEYIRSTDSGANWTEYPARALTGSGITGCAP